MLLRCLHWRSLRVLVQDLDTIVGVGSIIKLLLYDRNYTTTTINSFIPVAGLNSRCAVYCCLLSLLIRGREEIGFKLGRGRAWNQQQRCGYSHLREKKVSGSFFRVVALHPSTLLLLSSSSSSCFFPSNTKLEVSTTTIIISLIL